MNVGFAFRGGLALLFSFRLPDGGGCLLLPYLLCVEV
jgi:hypothetical protein